MNLLNNIKDIFEQLLGYMVVATSSSLIKVFYIKEEGSVWSKIGKFVSAILFGTAVGFLIGDINIGEKVKYSIVGAATLISDKLINYWVDHGVEYFKGILDKIFNKTSE